MEWLAKIGELAKLPVKFVAVVALVTGIVLFLPKNVSQVLYVSRLREDFGVYIAIAFLISSATLIIEAAVRIFNHIRRQVENRQWKAATRKRLESLDSAEQSVVREFYFDGQSTIKLPIDNPTVARLVRDGILFQIGMLGQQSTVGLLFSLALSETAKNFLTAKELGLSQYIIGSDGDNWMVNDEGIQWIRESRPAFMQKVERDRAILEGFF